VPEKMKIDLQLIYRHFPKTG